MLDDMAAGPSSIDKLLCRVGKGTQTGGAKAVMREFGECKTRAEDMTFLPHGPPVKLCSPGIVSKRPSMRRCRFLQTDVAGVAAVIVHIVYDSRSCEELCG